MSIKVVAIAAAKGGASKSTVAGALDVYAASDGERVMLIDAEPQHSPGLWWERRGKPENSNLLSSVSSASMFNRPYWIDWVHLAFGIVVLAGGITLQNGMTLAAGVMGGTLGLSGLLLGLCGKAV
jgi:cellulose biosynthesis protein BcsQ